MNSTIKKTEARQAHLKIMVATILMLIFYGNLWGSNISNPGSQPQFIEGSEVYVMAQSGLTMREKPDMHARSLGVIDLGTMLTVLNQPDSLLKSQKINYVTGQWIKVDYDGLVGYMFDGYLSDLPLPIYEFEMSNMDLDLIYPLESWAEHNLGLDTTTYSETVKKAKAIDFFKTGERMVKTMANDIYKVELHLQDVRMMDVYHLLQSMIDQKNLIKTFVDQTIFIEDVNGALKTIKVNLDNPIKIKSMGDGNVKITIHGQDYACVEME